VAKIPLISPNIRRSLFIVEITMLTVYVWININNVEFQGYLTILKLVIFGGSIIIFSLFLPIDRPLWQRRVYFGIEK
jgi:hypothetical protein